MNLAIVIVAAGAGRRFGGDKLAARIGDLTVLEASVDRLRAALPGVPIIVAVGASEIERWRSIVTDVELVVGGGRRQDSVRAGVDAAVSRGVDTVLIHDGARPVVHADDIRAVVNAVDGVDGAVLCGHVPDTVKRVSTEGAVLETIDRDRLRLAQTPQACRVAALQAAWATCDPEREFSDEAALLEAVGFEVRAVDAEHPNPKITTPADLDLVRNLIGRLRIGQGSDVHRFGGTGPLVLCGIEVEDEPGLLGHSDADVALHAVCDALYGAVGAGDIGEHFPDHDDRWRDAPSTLFVDHAVETVRRAGFRPVNCDLTIIGDQPKIAPRRDDLRRGLAAAVGLELDRVSVKATTSEGLGITGRGEGLAAMAVVLVKEDRDE